MQHSESEWQNTNKSDRVPPVVLTDTCLKHWKTSYAMTAIHAYTKSESEREERKKKGGAYMHITITDTRFSTTTTTTTYWFPSLPPHTSGSPIVPSAGGSARYFGREKSQVGGCCELCSQSDRIPANDERQEPMQAGVGP